MSDIVISVENVSKRYRLGLIGGGTLHDDFERRWAKARGRPDPLLKACPEPCPEERRGSRRIGQAEQGNRQGEYIPRGRLKAQVPRYDEIVDDHC